MARRYAVRRDVNHGEIEVVFRQMLGDHVTDSSGWGDGAGDLFVSFGRIHHFIEIKRDGKAEYTAMQIRFQNAHPHAVIRCETIEDAARICAEIRSRAHMEALSDIQV